MDNSRKETLRSFNFPRSDHEIATETIEVGLKAYRDSFSRSVALRLLAPFLGMTPRQLRGVLYQDCGYAAPRKGQRHRLRMGVINAIRAHADYHEERAEYWRRVADAEECHERQLALWGDACQPSISLRRTA